MRIPSNWIPGVLSVLILVGAMADECAAQTVPSGFQVDTLATGLAFPIDFFFLPDGRVLIANRDGGLQVYVAGAVAQIGTVPSVLWGGESGLLSIEIDSSFAQTGYIYTYYSSTADAYLHLDRFELVGDLSNPTSTNLSLNLASRRVILDSIPDTYAFHNGGTTRFGPDGMLYLSLGDDQLPCDAQSTSSARGSLLRMDVAGVPAGGGLVAPAISSLDPGDNPLSSNADISQLVIAYGLRNPFRMAIDSLTGNLYLGDVGASTAEEVNEYVYSVGALPLRNYGWPWVEGATANASACGGSAPAGLEAPILVGLHAAGYGSLIQGPRYRNQGGPFDFGASYEGSVFCLEYWSGWMRRLEYTTGWGFAQPVTGQPSNENWGDSLSRVTSMRQGPDGALYYTQTMFGQLRRIRPSVSSSVATFGTGCGSPSLDLAASAPPTIGAVAQVDLANVPTPFAFLAVGWSNTFWGQQPLPLSLAGVGMPGCFLLQSAEVVGLVATSTGVATATYSWPLPNLGSLIGLRVYLQGLALAPGYNPANLIVSNGLEWVLGNF